jgi:hypothetical protein
MLAVELKGAFRINRIVGGVISEFFRNGTGVEPFKSIIGRTVNACLHYMVGVLRKIVYRLGGEQSKVHGKVG